MGKYVIESKFENTRCFLEVACENREPYFFINRVESLTPYTEPDLEQVRKEGYDKGYDDATAEIGSDEQAIAEKAYQRGLSDAWEAARKICLNDSDGGLTVTEIAKIFDVSYYRDAMKKYSAHEAVEKIRQYEQEKRFCVGDEFENESGKRFVILKMDGTEIDRYIDEEGKTYCMIAKYKVMRKTGRHFPEIATVLEKMRGEQDG